jgi:hypothetical protein
MQKYNKAYDSIERGELYEIVKLFEIQNKLMRLIKAIKEDSTYHVKIGPMMADGFKVGNGLEQREGLAPALFNITKEYVIGQLSVQVNLTLFYKPVQLVGYADDVNIIGRTKGAISDVDEELRQRESKRSRA